MGYRHGQSSPYTWPKKGRRQRIRCLTALRTSNVNSPDLQRAELVFQNFAYANFRLLNIVKDDLKPSEDSPENIFFIEKTPYYLMLARKPSA